VTGMGGADRRIDVLVPVEVLRHELGPLPEGMRLIEHAPGDELTDEMLGVEVVVFGAGQRELLGRLDEFGALRLVQSLSAGVDMLVGEVPEGVVLANASGAHDAPVAEWVVAMLLAHVHLLPRLFDAQRRATWDVGANALRTAPEHTASDDLEGKRVLVLGHGSIGRAVAARLEPFGAVTTGITRHGRGGTATPDQLDDLVAHADALVVMAPLTEETRGMVSAEVLAKLPDEAIVLNAARGPVIDQDALERELRAGRLRAALDVTDPEPLPDGHPLWSAPNVIITPHIAGSARRWQARAYGVAGSQLRRYAAKLPLDNIRHEY